MNQRMMTVVIGGGLALMSHGAVHADIVQPLPTEPLVSGDGRLQVFAFDPMGQSFTAVDALIDSVGFSVVDINPGQSLADLTLTLYEGSGFGGSILATQTIFGGDILAEIDFVGAWNDFVFDSPVSLTIGDEYTARLTTTNARWGVSFSGSDPYAGGVGFFGGTAIESNDYRFRVLASSETVIPLPTPLGMGLAGLGLVAVGRRRR